MKKPLFSLPLIFLFSQSFGQLFSNLEYRFIGPEGNRAIAVVGEPGNHMVAYLGAASGGLWKTEDSGTTWNSILDTLEVSSISALAISQTDPKQVWAGTGETFLIRPAHSMGNGIYKTNNSGKSWTNMGLEKTARIGRIVVHPENPELVYAAAMGHSYGPQPERGIYRTKNGGETWEKVLFVDENTGAADVAINPSNPNVLFAGTWQLHINTCPGFADQVAVTHKPVVNPDACDQQQYNECNQ